KVVGTKSRVLIHLIGKIEIAVLLKNLPVTRTANLAQHPCGFIVRNPFGSNRHYVAMRPYLWRFSLCDMQIRCLLSDYDLQKLIKISHVRLADCSDFEFTSSLTRCSVLECGYSTAFCGSCFQVLPSDIFLLGSCLIFFSTDHPALVEINQCIVPQPPA